jgi:hypothetical protein
MLLLHFLATVFLLSGFRTNPSGSPNSLVFASPNPSTSNEGAAGSYAIEEHNEGKRALPLAEHGQDPAAAIIARAPAAAPPAGGIPRPPNSRYRKGGQKKKPPETPDVPSPEDDNGGDDGEKGPNQSSDMKPKPTYNPFYKPKTRTIRFNTYRPQSTGAAF